MMNCATMGCDGCPTEYFERGGVGSNYCTACYARILQEAPLSDDLNEMRAALLMITHKANEAAIYRDEDDVLATIIEIANAALYATQQEPTP